MDIEKIQAIQNKMIALQENIKETAADIDSRISVSVNGKLQIVNLTIDEKLSAKEIELKLPKILNDVILRASIKVQEVLKVAMQP